MTENAVNVVKANCCQRSERFTVFSRLRNAVKVVQATTLKAVTCCMLRVASCMLSRQQQLSRLLHVACCMLRVASCMLQVASCKGNNSLKAVSCCMLPRQQLSQGCCMLHVACCKLHVVFLESRGISRETNHSSHLNLEKQFSTQVSTGAGEERGRGARIHVRKNIFGLHIYRRNTGELFNIIRARNTNAALKVARVETPAPLLGVVLRRCLYLPPVALLANTHTHTHTHTRLYMCKHTHTHTHTHTNPSMQGNTPTMHWGRRAGA